MKQNPVPLKGQIIFTVIRFKRSNRHSALSRVSSSPEDWIEALEKLYIYNQKELYEAIIVGTPLFSMLILLGWGIYF